MQDELLSAADFIGAEQIQVAVNTLVAVAESEMVVGQERIHAAELLLRYGVRDPYYSPPTSGSNAEFEDEE